MRRRWMLLVAGGLLAGSVERAHAQWPISATATVRARVVTNCVGTAESCGATTPPGAPGEGRQRFGPILYRGGLLSVYTGVVDLGSEGVQPFQVRLGSAAASSDRRSVPHRWRSTDKQGVVLEIQPHRSWMGISLVLARLDRWPAIDPVGSTGTSVFTLTLEY